MIASAFRDDRLSLHSSSLCNSDFQYIQLLNTKILSCSNSFRFDMYECTQSDGLTQKLKCRYRNQANSSLSLS